MRDIDTCSIPFAELRKEGMLYVDKSLLIKDFLENNRRGVYLYTRPRRFGKSTNLTMLDAFFNIKYKGNTWFDDLEITKYPKFEKYKNAFPVIHLDLLPSKEDSYEGFLQGMITAVQRSYADHQYMFDDPDWKVGESIRYVRDSLQTWATPSGPLKESIALLSRELERYHGRKVVVLIDEYDCAISDSFGQESHCPMMKFLGGFMRSILKGNDSLQMACITGVMQIAKESIFSDLNNLKVNNIFSTMSDERFGFTEAEVKQILEEAEHPEKFDEVRYWYDGYRFGDAEVYNPYSIMNYVQDNFIAKSHWSNSGGDSIVRWLLERLNDENIASIYNLVNGGTTEVRLKESLIYSSIRNDELSIYSLMAMSGYLKTIPLGDEMYKVSLPNEEVRRKVKSLLDELYPINEGAFTRFNRAILDCDSDKTASELLDILKDASYLNLTDENVYATVVMTILHALTKRYEVRAEFEQGNGRVDVIMRPRIEGNVPMIFELKKVDSESRLDSGLDDALKQIHSKRYYLGMKGKVILAGMCFWGKVPKVKIETIDNGPEGRSYVML